MKGGRKREGEYSALSNLKYLIDGAGKWQPIAVVCTFVHALAQGLSVYVWLYAVKLMIGIFEGAEIPAAETDKLLVIVGGAAATELLMLVAANLCQKQAESRMHDVRFHYVLMWATKLWTMPFVEHENAKVQDESYKAKRAFSDPVNGLQGMHFWMSFALPDLIAVAAAMVILCARSFLLVFVMLLLSVARFLLIGKATVYEKAECVDKVVKEQRTSWYLNEITADFAYGKDIRLFRMQKPLYGMMRKINEFLYHKRIMADNMYAKCYVAGDCLEFLEEMIMYGWLVYMVLGGKMTIADFTLYLGSIRSFTTSASKALWFLVQVNFSSKKVSDYRSFLGRDAGKQEADKTSAQENGRSRKVSRRSFRDDYIDYLNTFRLIKSTYEWKKDAAYEFVFDHVSFRYPEVKLMPLRICHFV